MKTIPDEFKISDANRQAIAEKQGITPADMETLFKLFQPSTERVTLNAQQYQQLLDYYQCRYRLDASQAHEMTACFRDEPKLTHGYKDLLNALSQRAEADFQEENVVRLAASASKKSNERELSIELNENIQMQAKLDSKNGVVNLKVKNTSTWRTDEHREVHGVNISGGNIGVIIARSGDGSVSAFPLPPIKPESEFNENEYQYPEAVWDLLIEMFGKKTKFNLYELPSGKDMTASLEGMKEVRL